MNMIDTDPELLIPTAPLDKTVNTVETAQEDTSCAVTRKEEGALFDPFHCNMSPPWEI